MLPLQKVLTLNCGNCELQFYARNVLTFHWMIFTLGSSGIRIFMQGKNLGMKTVQASLHNSWRCHDWRGLVGFWVHKHMMCILTKFGRPGFILLRLSHLHFSDQIRERRWEIGIAFLILLELSVQAAFILQKSAFYGTLLLLEGISKKGWSRFSFWSVEALAYRCKLWEVFEPICNVTPLVSLKLHIANYDGLPQWPDEYFHRLVQNMKEDSQPSSSCMHTTWGTLGTRLSKLRTKLLLHCKGWWVRCSSHR